MILGIILVLPFLAGALEKWPSNRWSSIYYRFGIPIYISKDRYPPYNLPRNNDIFSYLKNIEINNVDTDLHYFRIGKFIESGYSRSIEFSPLRGYISYDQSAQIHRSVYFVNWHIAMLLFMLAILLFAAPNDHYMILVILIIFVIVSRMGYFIYQMKNELRKAY